MLRRHSYYFCFVTDALLKDVISPYYFQVEITHHTVLVGFMLQILRQRDGKFYISTKTRLHKYLQHFNLFKIKLRYFIYFP